MPANRPSIRGILIVAFLLSAVLFGCESGDSTEPQPASPWRYDSERAPYTIEVPGQWEERSAEELNRFADLALHMEERFFVIVIPQEIPSFEGVKSPDAGALKRASLGLLKERVDSFTIEREGPVTVDGQSALTVFAEGLDGQEPVQYINTYMTRGRWGYQVVSWGPKDNEEGLVNATDALMAGWSFDDDQPAEEAGSSGDKTAGDETTDAPADEAGETGSP